MASGANLLQYQLYLDSAHTTVWGDGTAGTSYKNDGYLLSVIAPVVRSYSVYGSIPGLQNVFAGVYGDTTTVLLTY
jgi:spore coat protein U-like protein